MHIFVLIKKILLNAHFHIACVTLILFLQYNFHNDSDDISPAQIHNPRRDLLSFEHVPHPHPHLVIKVSEPAVVQYDTKDENDASDTSDEDSSLESSFGVHKPRISSTSKGSFSGVSRVSSPSISTGSVNPTSLFPGSTRVLGNEHHDKNPIQNHFNSVDNEGGLLHSEGTKKKPCEEAESKIDGILHELMEQDRQAEAKLRIQEENKKKIKEEAYFQALKRAYEAQRWSTSAYPIGDKSRPEMPGRTIRQESMLSNHGTNSPPESGARPELRTDSHHDVFPPPEYILRQDPIMSNHGPYSSEYAEREEPTISIRGPHSREYSARGEPILSNHYPYSQKYAVKPESMVSSHGLYSSEHVPEGVENRYSHVPWSQGGGTRRLFSVTANKKGVPEESKADPTEKHVVKPVTSDVKKVSEESKQNLKEKPVVESRITTSKEDDREKSFEDLVNDEVLEEDNAKGKIVSASIPYITGIKRDTAENFSSSGSNQIVNKMLKYFGIAKTQD